VFWACKRYLILVFPYSNMNNSRILSKKKERPVQLSMTQSDTSQHAMKDVSQYFLHGKNTSKLELCLCLHMVERYISRRGAIPMHIALEYVHTTPSHNTQRAGPLVKAFLFMQPHPLCRPGQGSTACVQAPPSRLVLGTQADCTNTSPSMLLLMPVSLPRPDLSQHLRRACRCRRRRLLRRRDVGSFSRFR
jgi:hypothetical protein